MYLSAPDKAPDKPWLQRFLVNLGEGFFASIKSTKFIAVICPSLSAYHHTEHRVWLVNRALIQNFEEQLLKRGLPGIFFTYLEDSPEHQDWLNQYLLQNPTQEYIATGFDRGAANSAGFFQRRLRILAEAEQAAGRPLRVVLCSLMTSLPRIQFASDLFPGRIHLVASTVFQHSIHGQRLNKITTGLEWVGPNSEPRGWPLFEKNAQTLEEIVLEQVPNFYVGQR